MNVELFLYMQGVFYDRAVSHKESTAYIPTSRENKQPLKKYETTMCKYFQTSLLATV